jgi:hypothetical protein
VNVVEDNSDDTRDMLSVVSNSEHLMGYWIMDSTLGTSDSNDYGYKSESGVMKVTKGAIIVMKVKCPKF